MGYESENEIGIIPRFSKDLFKEIEQFKNQSNVCSYFYSLFLFNDKIGDSHYFVFKDDHDIKCIHFYFREL